MRRTEGKNGRAIRMKIHQNVKGKKVMKGWGLCGLPNFMIGLCICGIYLLYCLLWGTHWVP